MFHVGPYLLGIYFNSSLIKKTLKSAKRKIEWWTPIYTSLSINNYQDFATFGSTVNSRHCVILPLHTSLYFSKSMDIFLPNHNAMITSKNWGFFLAFFLPTFYKISSIQQNWILKWMAIYLLLRSYNKHSYMFPSSHSICIHPLIHFLMYFKVDHWDQ